MVVSYMSFDDGWAALNLEMSHRVPRTEYSASSHWELVSRVTGTRIDRMSPEDERRKASKAFAGPNGWNFDLSWSTLIGGGELGEISTNMGHAIYADGGTDYDRNIHEAFSSPEEVLSFDPESSLPFVPHDEIVARFENHYAANCRENPDSVNMTGIYITCVSGLIALLGWDALLLAAGMDSKAFGALTERYTRWIGRYYAALAEADVPVVMVHDDIVWTEGAFIQPEWYRSIVFPAYRKFFEPIIASGKKLLFTSDGDYTEFVDDIADCGVHGFVLEPLTDMAYIAERYGSTHVFVGNADTRVLLSGSREAIRAEVKRCMDIGRNCPGFIMAVGNHIPSNTPVESALYYNEVYEELSSR